MASSTSRAVSPSIRQTAPSMSWIWAITASEIRTSTNVLPQLLTKWGGSFEASHASSPLAREAGQLRSPWGIATVDGQGDVYVTDTGNHRLKNLIARQLHSQWGGFGGGDGQFNFPYGIVVDPRGSVFCRRQRQHQSAAIHAGEEAASGCRKKRMPQQSWGRWIKPRRSKGRNGQKPGRGWRLMLEKEIRLGLTYDDVVLVPAKSQVLPTEVDTRRLSRNIQLNIPIVSAAMDTVTEARLAIAMAQEGGIGIVHRVLLRRIRRLKSSGQESGMILDPITISRIRPFVMPMI